MNRKEQYHAYLQSADWKRLRQQARERADFKCEFCSGECDHVHHVQYPKNFKDDCLENLVVACELCHEKLHGIRSQLMTDVVNFEYPGLNAKTRIRGIEHNGKWYFSLPDIVRVFEVESGMFGEKGNSLATIRWILNNPKYSKYIAHLKTVVNGKEAKEPWIRESGMYRILLLGGTSPEAERFQDWVYDDLLPAASRGELPSNMEPQWNTTPHHQEWGTDLTVKALHQITGEFIEFQESTGKEIALTNKRVDVVENEVKAVKDAMEVRRTFDGILIPPDHTTVRIRLAFHGIAYDRSLCISIGGDVSKMMRRSGRKSFGKIQEGDQGVNVWPEDTIDAVLQMRGLINEPYDEEI